MKSHLVHQAGSHERTFVLRVPVGTQVEVLSIVGDVAHDRGKPAIHVHAVLGLPDGTTRGGHLLEARVWPTLELVITEWPAHLRKVFHPEVGLSLIAADEQRERQHAVR